MNQQTIKVNISIVNIVSIMKVITQK